MTREFVLRLMDHTIARSELATLRAERDELRAALELIAQKEWSHLCADTAAEEMRDQARAALAKGRP